MNSDYKTPSTIKTGQNARKNTRQSTRNESPSVWLQQSLQHHAPHTAARLATHKASKRHNRFSQWRAGLLSIAVFAVLLTGMHFEQQTRRAFTEDLAHGITNLQQMVSINH